MTSEREKLNEMEKYAHLGAYKTTKNDRGEALVYLVYRTEKRGDKIKGIYVPMVENNSHT